jgi:hypothetical protein
MFKTATTAALAAILLSSATAMAADPAVKCEAGKLKGSSKYSACRLKAESKAVLKGVAADYTKCDDKLTQTWLKIETKAESACVDTVLDTDIQSFLTAHTDAVAAALDGGALPSLACGNGVLDPGEDCDQSVLGGADCDLATGGAEPLGGVVCGGGCVFDTSGCSAIRFEIQDLSGEPTVVDHLTGLEWISQDEQSWLGESWSDTGTLPDGSVFWNYLADANAASYGGHDDWRLPEIEELESIVDPTKGNCGGGTGACIDQSLFGFTQENVSWSMTDDPNDANKALAVNFSDGTRTSFLKEPACGFCFLPARGVRSLF